MAGVWFVLYNWYTYLNQFYFERLGVDWISHSYWHHVWFKDFWGNCSIIEDEQYKVVGASNIHIEVWQYVRREWTKGGFVCENVFWFQIKYKMKVENVIANSGLYGLKKKLFSFLFFLWSILNPLKNDMEISGGVIHTILSYVNEW